MSTNNINTLNNPSMNGLGSLKRTGGGGFPYACRIRSAHNK